MPIPPRDGPEHTPLPLRVWAPALLALSLACVGTGPDEAPPPTPSAAGGLEELLDAEAPAASGLRVRLAFDARADLDLYVSDPLQETVYYANTPSRSGGFLLEDRRCIHAGPRVETVRFERPPAGRFRIGVDFPETCQGEVESVPFVVAVESRGERTLLRGEIPPRRFEPIVLEFELEGD